MNLSRRTFIASAALAPVACGGLSYEHGTPVAQPKLLPMVRPPQVGQEWTYIKKDIFDGKTLDVINERVASVGATIVLERSTANGFRLPDEIQSSWGMVSTDPQWPRLLNFNPPLPLWPETLSTTWTKQINSKYSIAGYSESRMGWQEYMSVQGWEKITVPAGEFVALRFQSLINYESEDPNKVDCIRKETIWFVPQIGRWVARETSGSYQIQGQIGAVILEGSHQLQLTSYK
ncbi:hypothetical protein FD977_06875 [Polynucleobacter sp. AP-Elch-400A-B2]|uniref:hypothetical protein n=1 Tax=Polynucleobacter sp. AP-Elch-400A-B2 TaxID=2576930 RepID=UPI001BFCF90D|nr:hypothetical protein [Polynucleobacter sp. AP-Elch-400A-B2]QWE23995.1 hypothetical protein FD977_06875 [Polynucleobacter sp. AP-Elch-400A-B2]